VVREGYEGLVRGNSVDHVPVNLAQLPPEASESDFSLIHNLRFGDGALLKDGTGDHADGRTLKGRYIVRVGWDDVRGWFSEVRSLVLARLFH
jgi:6-phosphofructokinase 1